MKCARPSSWEPLPWWWARPLPDRNWSHNASTESAPRAINKAKSDGSASDSVALLSDCNRGLLACFVYKNGSELDLGILPASIKHASDWIAGNFDASAFCLRVGGLDAFFLVFCHPQIHYEQAGAQPRCAQPGCRRGRRQQIELV